MLVGWLSWRRVSWYNLGVAAIFRNHHHPSAIACRMLQSGNWSLGN